MAPRIVQVSGVEVQAFASRSGFELTEETARQLAGYLELLMQWNRVMNLVGTRSWQETFSTLVVDSLHLGAFLEKEGFAASTAWDLGSGAGLPGIPLRIIWREGAFWMVEAREKRALFLSTVLARIPLPETHVFRGRVESFMAGPPPRKADLIMSRAFMPWPEVLTLVQHNLNPQGVVILLARELVLKELEREAQARNWTLKAASEYRVGQTRRMFCALSPLA